MRELPVDDVLPYEGSSGYCSRHHYHLSNDADREDAHDDDHHRRQKQNRHQTATARRS